MTTFTTSDDLRGARFVDANLHGARFVRSDLSGVVMRGVDVSGADIDAPWLLDGESVLRVPAHHPRGGVGAPPLRRARPRRDRGRDRRVSR